MTDNTSEERLALYIDHENVSIGARDIGLKFTLAPLLDALAERGRLIVRKSYADWNLFREDRRDSVDGHVELMEIPQRNDSVRKNAADIQMAVDAVELAFTRDFIGTFVIVSGDSDFTPLVAKLRQLGKRVIGVGLKGSTSKMLPPACDEFLFYDRLDGVQRRDSSSGGGGGGRGGSAGNGGGRKKKASSGSSSKGEAKQPKQSTQKADLETFKRTLTKTLAGLQSADATSILASNLKRALLRKDPTFSEADYGFRGFREFLRHFESEGVIVLSEGSAKGDPEVDFPTGGSNDEDASFALLRKTVVELMDELGGDPPLSGLKDQLRKRQADFSEKDLGYSGFLQFCKAAATKDVVMMDFEEDDQEYYLYVEDEPAKK